MTSLPPAPERDVALATDPAALPPEGGGTPSRRAIWQWALMAFGFALLAALVYQAGPRRLTDHLRALGWWAPVIFLPYAFSSLFDAAGWRTTFGHARPGLGLLYVVRLIGDSVNNVTPTAYLGGEPVKAYVLQRFGIPLADGMTSVILAKSALTIAQIAFVILGVALLFLQRGVTWATISLLLAFLAAGTAVTLLLVRWQRRGLVGSIAGGIGRFFPRASMAARLRARADEIDGKLRAFYEARSGAAVTSVALHLIGWIAGAAEVYAIMTLIDHPVGCLAAVVIDALAQPTRLLGILVPAALGVQEAGGMLIFGLLGLPPDLGLTLMLLKRVREMGFNALGLALLARLGAGTVRPLAVAAAQPSA
ncbi:MAG: flippase-like domain-containing protein [Deltaproteobacteria bacterium]|nr:flippase-like domain-containing protein [Deltaproteobacteria bacterium]